MQLLQFKAKLQQEVMENKNERYQVEIQALKSQLSSTLEDREEEIRQKNKIEEELRNKINNLQGELERHREQKEIIDKMKSLEVTTKKLDKMTEELNEALNLKDLEMADLLKLQTETERKLNDVQFEVIYFLIILFNILDDDCLNIVNLLNFFKFQLKKSEKQVAQLEENLVNISNESTPEVLTINQQLIDDMTNVLQEYFDYDNYDGKWNIESMNFPEDIENFLKTIRKFVTDLKVTYEREIELSRDNFNEERENLEQELEKKRTLVIDLENKLAETNETNSFLTEELQDVQKLYKDV